MQLGLGKGGKVDIYVHCLSNPLLLWEVLLSFMQFHWELPAFCLPP